MITTRLLRQVNARRCLRLLQDGASLSRADMARALGQTRATVGNAVAELIETGLVRESDPTLGKMGRPGTALHLNPQGATFIGIEIDTRAITGVVLTLDGQITRRLTETTGPDYFAAQAMTNKIASLAQALATHADKLCGIGLAIPGLVGNHGEVVFAPLLGWRDFPLQQRLADLPWPVEVTNDAFAFASAETTDANILMVLLAEGIGSAQIADGKLITGAHGFAGELGHLRIATPNRSGKFEALAGASAFPQAIGQGRAVAEGVAAILANPGDPDTQAALTDWAEALATGLANAALLIDPERIVLGGPLSALYPLVADKVTAHLAALCLHGAPPVHLARHTTAGAAIGAAMRLRERLFTLPDLAQPEPERA